MLKNLTKQFIKEEDGAGLIEYLLIIAIVAVIAIIIFKPLRTWIANLFNNAMCRVNGAISGGGAASCTMGANEQAADTNTGSGW